MRISFVILCMIVGFIQGSCLDRSDAAQQKTILNSSWLNEESLAAERAQLEDKFLVVALLGPEGCPWSEKMKSEILNHADFVNSLEDDAVLLSLSLKQGDPLSEDIKKRYQIDQYPLVVVFNPQGSEMARLGFLPCSAGEYAEELFQLTDDFYEVEEAVATGCQDKKEKELIELYQKSKRLSVSFYKEKLLEIGLKREKGFFFTVQQYALLLQHLKPKHEALEKIRTQVAARDPDNRSGAQFKLAVLDFEKLASSAKKKQNPRKTVKPLIEYLQKFGDKDRENVWKIDWMIAKYLMRQKEYVHALGYAKASYEEVPELFKPEVAKLIESIERGSL